MFQTGPSFAHAAIEALNQFGVSEAGELKPSDDSGKNSFPLIIYHYLLWKCII